MQLFLGSDQVGLSGSDKVEADDASYHDRDTDKLLPRQSLRKEQRSDDDDADARERCPQRIPDPDVEGQERKAQEEGSDRPAYERDDCPPHIGEPLSFASSKSHRHLEENGDS